MRIWIDILSPKQLWMFTSLAQVLMARGHEVLLTSRRYEQLDRLLDTVFRDWSILRIGRWGGKSLEGKLKASAERLLMLLDTVLEWRPDTALSSGSIEAARIAYGLRIPHLLVSDTPHSPVNRLSAPISHRVLTPWIIPKKEWIQAGAPPSHIRYYKALDPWFWLREFKPDKKVLEELGLEENRYVLLRMPETAAAYLTESDEEFLHKVSMLLEILDVLKLLILCRYGEQTKAAEKILGGDPRVLVVSRLLPGSSIIYFSTLFLGGGGTMSQEAAILGVPAFSIYPGKLPTVLRFLSSRGLLKHYRNIGRMVKEVRKVLKRIDDVRKEWMRRAEKLRKLMKPPEEIVVREVESLSG